MEKALKVQKFYYAKTSHLEPLPDQFIEEIEK
jgi:hypothetical protein